MGRGPGLPASLPEGILCVAAILFGSREFLELITVGLFGALLVFVAVELGRFGMKTDSYLVTGVIALFALAGQITTGFLVGMIVVYLMRRARRADNALPQEQIK